MTGDILAGLRWHQRVGEFYTKANVDDIAQVLGRSRETVIGMAHSMGLSRPKEQRYRRREPTWEPIIAKLFQQESSPSKAIEKLDVQALLLQLAEFLKSTPIPWRQ